MLRVEAVDSVSPAMDVNRKDPLAAHGVHSYIFIVVDHFSQYTFLKPMPEASAAILIEFPVHEV